MIALLYSKSIAPFYKLKTRFCENEKILDIMVLSLRTNNCHLYEYKIVLTSVYKLQTVIYVFVNYVFLWLLNLWIKTKLFGLDYINN